MIGKYVRWSLAVFGLNFIISVLGNLVYILKDHTAFNLKLMVPSSSSSEIVYQSIRIKSLTFWHRNLAFKFLHILYVKCK
jgi:hypothetical protein